MGSWWLVGFMLLSFIVVCFIIGWLLVCCCFACVGCCCCVLGGWIGGFMVLLRFADFVWLVDFGLLLLSFRF